MTDTEEPTMTAVGRHAREMGAARHQSPTDAEMAVQTLYALSHIAEALQQVLDGQAAIRERLDAVEQPVSVYQTIVNPGSTGNSSGPHVRMEPEEAPERTPEEIEAAVDFYADQVRDPDLNPRMRTPEQRAAAAAEHGVVLHDPSIRQTVGAKDEEAAARILAAEEAEEQRIIAEAQAEHDRQMKAAPSEEDAQRHNAAVLAAQQALSVAFQEARGPVLLDDLEVAPLEQAEEPRLRKPGELLLNEDQTREVMRVEQENPNALKEPKDYTQ